MFFLKLHPLIVQFPVGLLVTGVLLEVYGKAQNESATRIAGEFNIRLGFWFALVALAVGLLGVLSLEVNSRFQPFLSKHILYAFTTTFIFGVALILRRFKNRKLVQIAYTLLTLAGLVSVIATGYFGGELVHRFGVSTLHPVE